MTASLQITVLCKIRYGSQIGELDHIRATYDPRHSPAPDPEGVGTLIRDL